jgi:hypothetical protein
LSAKITIVEPSDRDPSWVDQVSVEQSMVHELLHIVLFAWDCVDGSDNDGLREQAIVRLERALFGLGSALPPMGVGYQW